MSVPLIHQWRGPLEPAVINVTTHEQSFPHMITEAAFDNFFCFWTSAAQLTTAQTTHKSFFTTVYRRCRDFCYPLKRTFNRTTILP